MSVKQIRRDAFRLPLLGWEPYKGAPVYLPWRKPYLMTTEARIEDVLGAGLLRVRWHSQGSWQSAQMLADDVRPARRLGPLLMSGPLVCATLAGFKTQTRRAVKPQPIVGANRDGVLTLKMGRGVRGESCTGTLDQIKALAIKHCPYGRVGDLLWVRETWGLGWQSGGVIDPTLNYRADGRQVPILVGKPHWGFYQDWFAKHCPKDTSKWQPSIFMPRWACRLILVLEEIRVEWLHEISEFDAWAEGLLYFSGNKANPAAAMDGIHDAYRPGWKRGGTPSKKYAAPTARDAFQHLIDLNRGGAWPARTLVYVLKFRWYPLQVPTLLPER